MFAHSGLVETHSFEPATDASPLQQRPKHLPVAFRIRRVPRKEGSRQVERVSHQAEGCSEVVVDIKCSVNSRRECVVWLYRCGASSHSDLCSTAF